MSSFSQQTKTLHGEVRDPLGALVTSASVDLLEDNRVIAHTINRQRWFISVFVAGAGPLQCPRCRTVLPDNDHSSLLLFRLVQI